MTKRTIGATCFGALSFVMLAGAAVAADAPAGAPLKFVGKTELPTYTGDFDHLTADVKANRLYMAAEDHGTLEVFNLKTGKHLKTVSGIFENPHSILLVPQKHQILVTDGTDTIKLLDDKTLAQVGGIKVHPGADSIGYDASNGHLYVVTGGKDVKMKESWLEEIDPVTGKKFGEVHFDADHVEAMAVEQHGPKLFINVTDKNEIDVIDKPTRTIVARWPVHEAQQNALAQLDEKTGRLFVVTRAPGKMLVLDSSNGKTLASFEAPGHVDGEVFDSSNNRVYAPGGDGWMGVYQEQDAQHFVELPRVTTAQGAKTIVLVPELHRVYLGMSPGDRTGGAMMWYDVQ